MYSVSDAYTNQTKKDAAVAKVQFDFPMFGLPGMTSPAAVHDLAEPGVAKLKERYESMKGVSDEVADAFRQSCSTGARAVTDYGIKLIDISNANTSATLDFFARLIGAKSPSELMAVSVDQASRNLDAASSQSRELWELARKAATESAEPIKKGVAGVLQKVS